jgi:tetratricopeptide (TPR) repeat protein
MLNFFPDRRERLFGRIADIHHLIDRARNPGLTAVAARPLMGKSWTLTEVARLLEEEGRFLVGYHESKGAETSLLLYAVSNLYTRWLADSSLRGQAISLWERHKENLVPRVGQMVGLLFEKIAAKQLPEGVGAVVRAAFDGLAEAQRDLLSGGLQLAPLPYDQALSLIALVAKISERRIVLILDAWEKSPSLRPELATLESFLKHRADWPHTHIFLAVRNQDVDSTKINDEGYRRANDLCRINGAAQRYDLPAFNQTDLKERARLIEFVRQTVSATAHEPEQRLLEMIDGYPGVLHFWTDDVNQTTIRAREDLRSLARDAHALRYLELEHLLDRLPDDTSRTLAARLAFFPRLDRETWNIFRDLLLDGQPQTVVDTLVDSNVLEDQDFPTYGHDTRHTAARQWFIKYKRSLFRRVSEQLIEATASCVNGIDKQSLPFLEALVSCSEISQEAGIGSVASCLIHAAQTVFSNFDSVSYSDYDLLCKQAIERNRSVATLVAISLLNRAHSREQRCDIDGAIYDYTAAIALADLASAEQLAIAFFNRGLMRQRIGDLDGEIEDYTAAASLENLPISLIAQTLINRAIAKGERGDIEGEINDYCEVINWPNMSAEYLAQALIQRADSRNQQDDICQAISDYALVTSLPGASVEQIASALLKAAQTKERSGDYDAAISDYTAVIELRGSSSEHVALARFNRGFLNGLKGNADREIADYTAVATMREAPVAILARSLVNLGFAKGRRGDHDGAMVNYTATINLLGAPEEYVAQALVNRGVRKGQRGESYEALADFSIAIELPGAPAQQVALALLRRGRAKEKLGDRDGAINDYVAAIDLHDAPVEVVDEARQAMLRI